MKIVKCENGKVAYIDEIDGSLESMQKYVDGYIEAIYPFKDDVALICNDEGKFNGMKANRTLYGDNKEITDVIYGQFFICGCDRENFISLNDEQAEKYRKIFETPERIAILGGRPTMIPCRETI